DVDLLSIGSLPIRVAMVAADDRPDDSLEFQLRLFARGQDRIGGNGFEQIKDHLIAGYENPAGVVDMLAETSQLFGTPLEAFRGFLDLFLVDVCPEALDDVSRLGWYLDHKSRLGGLERRVMGVFPIYLCACPYGAVLGNCASCAKTHP